MEAESEALPASTTLVRNERTKLLANAPDRASTASFALGVLAPIVAAIYEATSPHHALYFASVFWIAAAFTLHAGAHMFLGD